MTRGQETEEPGTGLGSPSPSSLHTLLMSVTVYTNNSGSAPFFSCRMDIRLAHGRVPATQKGAQSL